MNIEIHGAGVDITRRLREHIERKADLSLDRFAASIQSLQVTLEDANGPRGGVDQVCRLVVHLQERQAPMIAEATHESSGGAIELAFGKVSHAISRDFDRRARNRRRVAVPT